MSVRCLPLLGLSVTMFACAVPPGAEQLQTLGFTLESHTIRVIYDDLSSQIPPNVKDVCNEVDGNLLYGYLPHRYLQEPATSTEHFIYFSVAYPENEKPRLWVDLDGDGFLECKEELDVTVSSDRRLATRSIEVTWLDEFTRTQRYRIAVPLDMRDPEYTIELYSSPVARWTQESHTTIWVLHDGNFNGAYDRRFGDGVLVDTTGEGRFDMDPYEGSFRSYHLPIALPWGTYEIAELDARGRHLKLRQLTDAASPQTSVLVPGDSVPEITCESLDGDRITLGGATGHHQLLFFWVSSCGSCLETMDLLLPLFEEADRDELTVVGINMDADRASVENSGMIATQAMRHCYSGKTLWDNAVARRFGKRVPSDFVIIDPTGRYVTVGHGATEAEAELITIGLLQSS